MSLSTIIFILIQKVLVQGLFHENSVHIIERPSFLSEHSLYGYSIAYQGHSLIVSDPIGDGVGKIYLIDIDSPKNSTKVTNVPIEELRRQKLANRRIKHDFWLGASVKANENFFVTCSPRYAELKSIKVKGRRDLATVGLCYLKPSNGTIRRLPVLTASDRLRTETRGAKLMDSFGWTTHITSQNELLVGGPAVSKGRVIKYEKPMSKDDPKLFEKISHSNPVLYNFGYSITSGTFFGKEISYAVSSPFGNLGYGKVYFFNSKLDNIGAINDIAYSSLFGAALCSAMLPTGALVVGAPLYTDSATEYDVGAVYIYMADTGVSSKEMFLKQKIKGKANGGYFGNAILNLGDMDGDSMDEIAIAAPYEDDGRGAIYIYTGKGLLEGRYSQRLHIDGFKYFGFSMTTVQDYNENGCNELAISSPMSDKIALVNSLAFITVKLRAVFPNSQNITLGKYFEFESCFDVTYPEKPKDIEADLIVSIESSYSNVKLRRLGVERSELTYEQSVKSKESSYCQSIGVITSNITEKEYNLVLAYKISAKLKENPLSLTEFDISRVLLSENSELTIENSVWTSVCVSDHCVPNLSLIKSCSISTSYIIGSTNEETLHLTISNAGENAYSACVVVTIPKARTIRYPKGCSLKQYTSKISILCKPEILLETGKQWIIPDITIETNYLTSLDDSLNIMYDLYDNCNDQSGHKSYADSFPLTSDFDGIFIMGKTIPEEFVNLTTNDIQFGKTVEHHYTLYNNGTTNWINVQSEITLENVTFVKYSEAPITINTGSSLIECAMTDTKTNGNNITMLCDIGDLRINEKVVVVVSIEIPPETIGANDENRNITISTSINLLLKGQSKYSSLQTVLRLQRSEVPLWVIVIASLIGLILVCAVGYILYKSGFLRRKNKQNLMALKKSVYRQSMQRSAMRESMRVTATRKSTEDVKFLRTGGCSKSD
ncbi:unnamed protein product, partial [Brenthis ino]